MSNAFNSPDMNPEDYNVSLEMWQRVYRTKFHNAKELNRRVLDMQQSVIDDTFSHQLPIINDTQVISVVNVPVHVFM